MMLPVILMILATASALSADLYATAVQQPFDHAIYYRISIEDASHTLLSDTDVGYSMTELALASDRRYYATTYDYTAGVWRVDPRSGDAEYIGWARNSGSTFSLAATPDGLLHATTFGVHPADHTLLTYDIAADDWHEPVQFGP